MATYANQSKSSTRTVNYLRHGVVPVMGQLATRISTDVSFIDTARTMAQIAINEFVAISYANQSKDATSFINQAKTGHSLTWDQDVGTSDENTGTWDDPYFYSNQMKSTSVFANATKH